MGTSWVSRKGGILEKGGGLSRKEGEGGGYDLPYQLQVRPSGLVNLVCKGIIVYSLNARGVTGICDPI